MVDVNINIQDSLMIPEKKAIVSYLKVLIWEEPPWTVELLNSRTLNPLSLIPA